MFDSLMFIPIHTTVLILYHLKTSENEIFLWFLGMESDQWHEMG